jgi:beta-glucosidase
MKIKLHKLVLLALIFSFQFYLYSNEADELENKIDLYLSKMTVPQKVGQLFMVEIGYITPEEVRKYSIGAVLNGGGSFPNQKRDHTVQDWIDLADQFYIASSKTEEGRWSMPVFWGTDAVHGHNNLRGATIFPHNIGLGATRNPKLVEKINNAVATEVSASGVDLTFAPAVSVPRDDRWGRTYEGFSEDPKLVALLGKHSVIGLQGKLGNDFLKGKKILATAKHFIGDGGTLDGVDKGNTILSEEDLIEIHAQGYISTINAGVQFVMASFNSWNGDKLHGQKYLLSDLLKDQLGFDGIVLGDWNGHQEVAGCSVESCANAINAGLDMFMITENWRSLYKNTLQQVLSGEILEVRLEDAVRRILRVKLRYGLHEKGKPSSRISPEDINSIGSSEHRDLARKAVQESLVLLKNNKNVLPIDPSKKILIVGEGSKRISKATGGWSLTWQGSNTDNSDFPKATSIYDGFSKIVKEGNGKIEYSVDGKYKAKPDIAILVIGENPYAEYQGSVENLLLTGVEFNHLRVASQYRKENIKVITLLISGRPLWVNRELNASDAFVAAWLPGTEGGGVADILFLNPRTAEAKDFKGKLSFSWPKEANQSSVNLGDKDYSPLFSYGYGLSYKDEEKFDELSERMNSSTNSKLGKSVLEGWPKSGLNVVLQTKNEEVFLNNKNISTGNEEVSVSIFDNLIQEDSQRITFQGNANASWSLLSSPPINWLREEKASGVLSIQMKVLRKDSYNELYFKSSCGDDCGITFSLSKFLENIPQDEWFILGIPLKCLKENNLDLSTLSKPLGFNTKGSWTLELGRVYLEGGMGGKSIFPCSLLDGEHE